MTSVLEAYSLVTFFSGKTFVAAELLQRRLKKVQSKRGLFLVPCRNLVDQQANAIEEWIGRNEKVDRFHGGLAPPGKGLSRILVSTPEAFIGLQSSRLVDFGWDTFSVCVFDEVHHVLKDHPYRRLALNLRNHSEKNAKAIQIIGLSASLTYAVDERRITKVLNRLCFELRVTKMCAPTTEDLIAGGYVPKNDCNVEILDSEDEPSDIVPVSVRKPHLVHATILKRIEQRCATDLTLLVWDTVQLLEKHIIRIGIKKFKSPLANLKLTSWEEYAATLKNCITLTRYRHLFQQLEHWYVALRLLFVSWEEEAPLALSWLQFTSAFASFDGFDGGLKAQLELVNGRAVDSRTCCGKLRLLCEQLKEKKDRFGPSFRCIIFAQQRISAYILSLFINTATELRTIGLKAGFIASSGSKITPSVKVTPSVATESLSQFRKGTLNVLVATAVAEEVSALTANPRHCLC